VTSFHFESYLALPHSSQPAEDYGITGHEYLNDDVSARLASVFMNHTDPPRDCWTALWVGYGDNPEPVLTAQQIEIGPRECVLARGSLDFVTGRGDEHGIWPVRERSPDFWWGTGERWLVSSDTDLDATYIACSSDCCGELLEMGINGLTAVPPDHPTIGPEPRD
jgi:hypothetical protein